MKNLMGLLQEVKSYISPAVFTALNCRQWLLSRGMAGAMEDCARFMMTTTREASR